MDTRSAGTFGVLAGLGSIVLALVSTTSCAADGAAPAGPPPSAKLWSAIRAEIGDAACDEQRQCHSLAIGAKPCGGPEAYVAWSSKRSDAGKLQALAAQHQAARRAENEREGLLSNCAMVVDPGASCVPAPPSTAASAAIPGLAPAPVRICRLNSAAPDLAR